MLHPADEAQIGVAHQDAGQEPGFDQDLKAIADTENQPALGGMSSHRVHDGRPRGDCPAAQIIAIGKAAGQQDEISASGQGSLTVPDEGRLFAGHFLDGADRIPLTIRAWEENDGGVHGWLMFSSLMAVRKGKSLLQNI
jgi:hypothetical protein